MIITGMIACFARCTGFSSSSRRRRRNWGRGKIQLSIRVIVSVKA
jgi:hypothetical protein